MVKSFTKFILLCIKTINKLLSFTTRGKSSEYFPIEKLWDSNFHLRDLVCYHCATTPSYVLLNIFYFFLKGHRELDIELRTNAFAKK